MNNTQTALVKLEHGREYLTLAWFSLALLSGLTWLFGKATKQL